MSTRTPATSLPSATYAVIRPPHRTFLMLAVLFLALSALAAALIGVTSDGFTAGTALRVVFILALVGFFWTGFRAGTTVDADGMTIRRGVGTRRVPWDRVERLGTDQPDDEARRVTALVDGQVVVLTGVYPVELERISAAASAGPRPAG